MKKILCILLLISGFSNAQIVNIPDADFKTKLISLGVDTNSDGNIQTSEALVPTSLNLSSSSISNLTGINSFTNLTNLNLQFNFLSSLNISSLINLQILICSNNQLTSINFGSINNLTQLYCNLNQLTSLNVTNFSNLTLLNCASNLITSLNISNLNNLTNLNCSTNQLSTLNLTGLTNLQTLNFSNNLFSSIDVSGLTSLQTLICNNNSLSSLNISGLTNLQSFNCNNNLLASLNLVGLNSLQAIYCSNNQLTSLVLTGFNLYTIYCNNNQLASLDISNMTELIEFNCSNNLINSLLMSGNYHFILFDCAYNNLTSIDLSGDTSGVDDADYFLGNNPLVYLNLKNGHGNGIYFENTPTLSFICEDENEAAGMQLYAMSYGYTNIVVNSYCSFTPGGNHNTITGSVTFDGDNNGCDASDLPHPNIRIDINDGINQGATFTNNTGNYNFYTQSGSFTLTPNLENPSWFNVSPSTATIPFANNNNNTATQNFCISANGVHPDLEIVIAPIVPARPGFEAVYQIVYKNKGNQSLSQLYGVNFFFNQNLMEFVSATTLPSTVGSGALSWSYSNLLPFESRSIYVTLNINTPTDTNPVNIGDVLQFTTSILPMEGDESTSDNTFLFNQTVVGSYDPNDITCMEGNVVSPSEIGEYLHYVVNFENSGTAEAENIVVKTEIDTVDFDINSLQLLDTSHNCYTRVTGNIVEFIFQNIALDTGGHGNVLLKIRSKSNLVTGDTVSKQANIFFDYNAPILTNIENTTFQALNNNNFDKDNSISIYPNPTNSNVNINCNNTIKSIQLYDVQGRLLQTKLINETASSIDISDKSNGIYFLKINSDKGIKVEKIVKE